MKHLLPKRVILIGASTGGPMQIRRIIQTIEHLEDTAVVIAQHMGHDFIPSFISQLQEQSRFRVVGSYDEPALRAGEIYLCSGTTTLVKKERDLVFHYEASTIQGYNPDINRLFVSFSEYTDMFEMIGVILTGIGDDGVSGLSLLSDKGVRVMTQDSSSAVVDGMSGRAREMISAVEVHASKEIEREIKEFAV